MKKPSKKVVKKISKLPVPLLVVLLVLVIIGVAFYFVIYPNLDTILAKITGQTTTTTESTITTTTSDSITTTKNENIITTTIDDIITTTTTNSNITTTTNISGEDYDKGIKYSGENIHLCDDGFVEDAIYEDFEIHFMELGNQYAGDSTYIKAGDIDIIIDAGSRKGSASTIYEYVNNYCTDGIIEYVIATHAHQDHIAGFVGNKTKTQTPFGYESERTGLLYYYRVGTIIDFAITDVTSTLVTEYRDAVDYAVSKGATHYTAAECFNEENGAKKHYALSDTLNISFDVLYNKFYFEHSSDENNYSVCTMFNYNDLHFLLTGDLEEKGEESLANYYDGSTPEKTLPKVELFKAGHHGSKTSSNDCLLSKIEPKICCVCCCAGSNEYTKNVDNIFPTQDFISRIAVYTDRVYVTSLLDEKETVKQNKHIFTSMNGNICISSNGEYVSIYASNNLIKLKDTDWFSETIYLVGTSVSSGTSDYYTKDTPGATGRVRRTWP